MDRIANMDRSTLGLAGIVLAAVIFFAVNIFAGAAFHGARIDLTEEKLFTLSDGTENVLRSIDEPITVRLFVTRRLTELNPAHAGYAERIRELLEQYVEIAAGKVRLELYNPEPFTDQEDLAVAYGLQGVPLDNTGELGYFGLVASNSTDDLKAMPYLSPERESFLEYDLTKMIFQLANPDMPTVGLISSLPIAGGAGPAKGRSSRT